MTATDVARPQEPTVGRRAVASSPKRDGAGRGRFRDRSIRRLKRPHLDRRDRPMANRQLVLAVFPDELAADSAAVALKDSGIADGDAIGILALDADGKLKQDKVGAHSTHKGAAIGGVIAVFGTALLGPAVLTGGAGRGPAPKKLGGRGRGQGRLPGRPNPGEGARRGMAP